jgi:hypothetical protein
MASTSETIHKRGRHRIFLDDDEKAERWRERSKSYYQTHREQILEKAKLRYEVKREATGKGRPRKAADVVDEKVVSRILELVKIGKLAIIGGDETK